MEEQEQVVEEVCTRMCVCVCVCVYMCVYVFVLTQERDTGRAGGERGSA